MVVAGEPPGAPWSLRADDRRWVLEPLGHRAGAGRADGAGGRRDPRRPRSTRTRRWWRTRSPASSTAMVRSTRSMGRRPLGRDADVAAVTEEFHEPTGRCSSDCSARWRSSTATDSRPTFERSKTLELIAWLALHREHSTRAGARTALWELDVRDATFANVVSEARRAMARLVAATRRRGVARPHAHGGPAAPRGRASPTSTSCGPDSTGPVCSRRSWRSRRCARPSS